MPHRPATRATVAEAEQHVVAEFRRSNRVRLGFMLGFLLGVILVIAQGEYTRQNLLDGCERANERSLVSLNIVENLIASNKERIKAASSKPEAEANRFALDHYRENREQLVALAAANPERPGSVEVDCDEAYPPAPPLGWF